MRLLLTGDKLREICRQVDRAEGDTMVWQYGAAVALNYICVLHGGDEGVAWTIVVARYVLRMLLVGVIALICAHIRV